MSTLIILIFAGALCALIVWAAEQLERDLSRFDDQ